MGNNFANTDGTMSEQSAAYYAERAKGGFGLITIEATVVHPDAKGGPRKPCLYDDSMIESFQKVIEACHREGAKVSIQLQNAGPEGNAKNAGAPIKAASSICTQCGRDIPQTLTTEEITWSMAMQMLRSEPGRPARMPWKFTWRMGIW